MRGAAWLLLALILFTLAVISYSTPGSLYPVATGRTVSAVTGLVVIAGVVALIAFAATIVSRQRLTRV